MRKEKLSIKETIIVILSLAALIVSFVALPIVFAQKSKIVDLSEKNKALLQENEILNQEKTQLELDLEEKNTRIKNMEEEIAEVSRLSDIRENANNHLREQLGSLTKENHQLWDEHLFFSAYAVILPNDGTGIFHKHGCSMLSTSSGFWIYKTGSAFSKGYDPCVYCMQSGYYIGNINSGVYHRPTCGTLPDLWNRTYFYTKAEAQNAGYRACGNCHP